MQYYEDYWQAIQAIAELHPVEIGAGFTSFDIGRFEDSPHYQVKLTSGETYTVTGRLFSDGARWQIMQVA